ncbi:hypothetical protein, partial [Methanobacterium sp. A39]|uniref:hypothetical protein n=1 Tax=Methanobacterium sp. A39 TaxID=1860100 RepID=UPI00159F0359
GSANWNPTKTANKTVKTIIDFLSIFSPFLLSQDLFFSQGDWIGFDRERQPYPTESGFKYACTNLHVKV